MSDQAARLRAMAPAPRPAPPAAGPTAIVLGSGKGGVGKSVLAIMLAAAAARQGQRVLLLDGAQNLGNLHVLLGCAPTRGLDALLHGECAPADLLQPVADRLWLLPGESGTDALYALSMVDRARLHHRLSALYDRFDAVVIDGGSGLENVVRVGTMRATRLAVVTVPEPAALTDAYALIKIVTLQAPHLPVDVLVNRADAGEAEAVHDRLDTAADRFLRRRLGFLGAVPDDPDMRATVRDPRRLLAAPGAAGAAITAMAGRLLADGATALAS